MKLSINKISILLISIFSLVLFITSTAFQQKEKVRIGFLVHDLVSERWKLDVGHFSNKVEELGGEVIVKNALGDANSQINQGKMLIDEGVKVLVVVAQDGELLKELVEYAEEKGAKVIAYDRMISNCNLHYYISYNSVRVGELMAEHAIKRKPKGNYVLLYGPTSDNNALLVKKGIKNVLQKSIESGDIKVIKEVSFDSWYGLDSYIYMEEFLSKNKLPVDVIIASNDDLAGGVIDALKLIKKDKPIVTGQDASIEACKNIMQGYQSMTVYKSILKLSQEAAVLAMKVANKEKIQVSSTFNNGTHDVPSILFDAVSVDKSNIRKYVY